MSGIDLIGRLQHPVAGEAATELLAERDLRNGMFSRSHAQEAPHYVATRELMLAVDVALSLGRPLLLTGEPGSGKTLAASWIAHCLGLSKHFEQFQVHSDSQARDLRYDFDSVSWFRASQLAQTMLPKDGFITPRPLGRAFGWPGEASVDVPYVVLIDEIDKAPRDFPNDLLLELDQMWFVVTETDKAVGPPKRRPVIVITSNAERRLPDPFLRRCIVHHIQLDDSAVGKILTQKVEGLGGADANLVRAATVFWSALKKTGGLARSPTIAEYWQWLALASRHGGKTTAELAQLLDKGPAGAEGLPLVTTLLSLADLQVLIAGGT